MKAWTNVNLLGVLLGNGEIAMRLGAAALLGSALGLNRLLHGKPAGMRTHGLVSLGAAVAVILSLGHPDARSVDINAISRVLPGVLTGIGFLGAGVILRDSNGHVAGLTTAATIWLCAVLGIACGLGYWPVVGIALGLTVLLLALGAPVEYTAGRLWKRKTESECQKNRVIRCSERSVCRRVRRRSISG
jgi:putative Mg2+ transporter-C (MgtC) family protein